MKHAIPTHLSAPSRRWVKQIVADFDLESFHFRLLVKAADAWDRSEQAREQIAADGITVPDRYGVLKAHPAVAIERDSRLAFARLLRELALDAAIARQSGWEARDNQDGESVSQRGDDCRDDCRAQEFCWL